MLDKMFGRFKKIIIMGDFNCDPAKYPKEADTFKCIMSTFNMIHTIEGFTRVTKTNKSRLDNIYINFRYDSYTSCIYDPGISDHAGQIIAFEKLHPEARPTYELIKTVSCSGLVRLKAALAEFDWDDLNLERLVVKRP